MPNDNDRRVLRDLAKQVADIAAKDVQDRRRDLWRRHNALERTRPLIYVRWFACTDEVIPPESLRCRDGLFRQYERAMRFSILQDRLGDDTIVEPWITVGAVHAACAGPARWGVPIRHSEKTAARGTWKFVPALADDADLDRLVPPRHVIDELATAERLGRMRDAVGDLIEVNASRAPVFWRWAGDISTDIAQLLGLEPFMLAMMDRPTFLHRLLAFMRDGILAAHAQAEAAGDWTLGDHENQAMPYATGLPDPAANSKPVKRKDLWCFLASQETTLVSPAMFEEFMLRYQIPIMAEFGLSAYGCCEDLTRKIDLLRKIPNLRRIAVTPWADVAACAEQIGTDYVFSWRPSPAEMICRGFDPARVRRIARAGLDACRGTHVDVTLKDIETIAGRFEDLVEWTRIVREVIEESC